MKALRLEENEDWGNARDAWHRALGGLEALEGSVVAAMRHEFLARARSAGDRADEPPDQPAFKTEALTEKPADPDPGAAAHLDAGETQGKSGAI
jgi:hypothetical protein